MVVEPLVGEVGGTGACGGGVVLVAVGVLVEEGRGVGRAGVGDADEVGDGDEVAGGSGWGVSGAGAETLFAGAAGGDAEGLPDPEPHAASVSRTRPARKMRGRVTGVMPLRTPDGGPSFHRGMSPTADEPASRDRGAGSSGARSVR